MDDIVARLRVATVADSADSLYQLMTDAADEIERLRKDRTDWMATAIHLANLGSELCDTEGCWHCGRAHSAINDLMRQTIRRLARGR